MHFNMYVIVSDGQFVQVEVCKCYPAGYRCQPHTERVPMCKYERNELCCKIRDTKDNGSLRKQQLTNEHNKLQKEKSRKKKRAQQKNNMKNLLNMFMHRRLGKYV